METKTTTFDKLPFEERVALLVNFHLSIEKGEPLLKEIILNNTQDGNLTFARVENDFMHCQDGAFEEFLEDNGYNK